ncbi:DUF2520 domain-containing protein [Aquirufa rosea]|uniref:Uncharacterized protein n=1 Tax=Aquirufa rosea TaxID=2509241 RepID=A0A4Q1C1T9_9BACT|nr:DUF2520 domain-containing protein [Aquirufa rosea]RXK51010.1 hypothetical protein ESB04_04970 [Aquirufa rosea]
MNISFIGAGHVAWHLSQALENAGHSVQEVFSRDPAKAKDLVTYLYNAKVQEHLDFSESKSSVFFLCVPDMAYPVVLKELLLPKYATLLLVSGTVLLAEASIWYDPARESTNQLGVFFPVQHLQSGRKINLSHMPICLEVLVEETEALSVQLAKDITDAMYLVNGQERKKIYLSMLLAGIFTQQLWNEASRLLHSIELDTSLLQGLIQNYVQSYFKNLPVQDQIEAQSFKDGRLMIEQQSYLSSIELQEVYRNMVQQLMKAT